MKPSMIALAVIFGIVLLGAIIGICSGRRRQMNLEQWTVRQRSQTLAQMALAWVLRHGVMSSALVGASRVEQIEQCVDAVKNIEFTAEELQRIDEIAQQD